MTVFAMPQKPIEIKLFVGAKPLQVPFYPLQFYLLFNSIDKVKLLQIIYIFVYCGCITIWKLLKSSTTYSIDVI